MLERKLEILSSAELEQIHEASLTVLSEAGVRIEHPRMIELLLKESCRQGKTGDIICFPKEVVKRHLERARAEHIVPQRLKELRLVVYTLARYIFDDTLGRTRQSVWADLVPGIRVAESMRYADIIAPLVLPCDIPAEGCDLLLWAELFRWTKKPASPVVFDKESVGPMLDLCSIYLGSIDEVRKRNFMTYSCFVTSPLTYTRYALDLAFEFAKYNLPVTAGSNMPISGSTAPVTLAGTLTLSNAETLSGIVITHLLGGRVGYSSVPVVIDQNTMMASYASPDKILMSVAQMDFKRFYGLDDYNTCIHTGKADSGLIDIQSAAERAYTYLIGALAGSMRAYAGELSIEVTSITQLLIDDELCSLVNRLLKGITVDTSTLCTGLICSLGPGGDFLNDERALELTVENFRKELWFPTIFTRRKGAHCILGDGDAYTRARQKVEAILGQPAALAVTDAQDRQIEEVLIRAKRVREKT